MKFQLYPFSNTINIILICSFLDDGISIPSSYTSFLAPVHSPKLYGEISARYRDPTKLAESYNFEMPWVVHQQNRFPLAETQPLFTFHHPNKGIFI